MATIRYLAEQALTKYLAAAGLGVDVRAGGQNGEKEAPLVVCTVREWVEDEINLNWYRIKATVETKVIATETPETFDALCAAVRDALRITDLGTELANAQSGIAFPLGAISAPDNGEFSISEDMWIETRTLELYCALTS